MKLTCFCITWSQDSRHWYPGVLPTFFKNCVSTEFQQRKGGQCVDVREVELCARDRRWIVENCLERCHVCGWMCTFRFSLGNLVGCFGLHYL